MNGYRYLFFTLCLLSCNLLAWSQALKPVNEQQKKEVLSQIAKMASNTSTLECHFVQKKNISVLSEVITSEGLMYFKKENNLRWQYNKPYSYLFILSGGKVLIKNESRTDRFNTDSNKLFKEISEIMIGGVRGTILTDNKKFASQFFETTTTVVIRLTPRSKEMQQMMHTINLTFSKSDWLVKSIEMQEKGGDNTLITFTEKNVNKTISDTLFRTN